MNTLAFVSRRAAGVWTHLPSLTLQLLHDSSKYSNALWVDFGRRFEMLNHLGINPSDFPRTSSLVGIIEALEAGTEVNECDLVSLSRTVLSNERSIAGLSRHHGKRLTEYRDAIRNFETSVGKVYMLARDVLGAQREAFDLEVVRAALGRLVSNLKPDWVVFTFEGQPEASIFRNALQADPILQWALNESSAIASLVRFDAAYRFRDSVGIPIELSKKPEWRKRLLLLLTRCSSEPKLTEEVLPYYLGSLPFARFVGASVNAGRIPLIDLVTVPLEEQTEEQHEYRNRLKEVSRELAKRFTLKEDN